MSDEKKGVSVVICCFNSAGRLPQTLSFISRQQVAPDISWEVIVVDNNSSDLTGKVASEIWRKFDIKVPLKVCTEPTAGLINARVCGLKNAVYETVIFCDDDNWLDATYVENAFNIMREDGQLAAVGGCGVPHFDSDEPDWFSRFSSFYALGSQENSFIEGKNKYRYLYGAGIVIRKAAMLQLYSSGFRHLATGRQGNRLLSGEDIELVVGLQMLGYKVKYFSSLTFIHFMASNRLQWRYLLKLLFNIGYSGELLYRFRSQEKLTFPYPNYSSLGRETKALIKAVIVTFLPFRKYQPLSVKFAMIYFRLGAFYFHFRNQHRFRDSAQSWSTV